MLNSPVELLPCPFCGGGAELIEDPDDSGPRVICIGTENGGCEMEGPRAFRADYEDNAYAIEWAVAQWNTREPAIAMETRRAETTGSVAKR